MPDLADDLRQAVQTGALAAWFQPQIELRTGRIVAAEALCRWDHADLGPVPAADFIELAERIGVIDELGRFMARAGIVAIGDWGIGVSVNVSPAQLEDSFFGDWIEGEVSRLRRNPSLLTLEITEGLPIHDATATIRRLDRLRGLGIGIAVDDFGSGQASLKQLRRLHATELKIDRALVVDQSPDAEDVLRIAIDAAHADGVRVVAEGIETQAQLTRVARLECDRGQGFLLGRPMPKDDFAELLTAA